jgi:hypothetical protein
MSVRSNLIQDTKSLTPSLPSARLCHNPSWSLRAAEGSVTISLFSMCDEIASVVSLPRNDITTQSQREEGKSEGIRITADRPLSLPHPSLNHRCVDWVYLSR